MYESIRGGMGTVSHVRVIRHVAVNLHSGVRQPARSSVRASAEERASALSRVSCAAPSMEADVCLKSSAMILPKHDPVLELSLGPSNTKNVLYIRPCTSSFVVDRTLRLQRSVNIYAGNTSTPAGRTLAEHHEADMLAYPGIHAERGPMRGKARLHTCLRWLRAATSELAWLIGAATTRTARVARHSEHAPTLERCTAGNLSPSRVNILYKRAGQGGV